MAKETHNGNDETNSLSPEEADRKGKVNIVKGVVDDPEVQNMIKDAVIPHTIKASIYMAAFFLGLFKVYDVAKNLIGFGWQGDLTISIILILVGSRYTISTLFKKKK